MKPFLLLMSVVALIAVSGCIFPGHRGGDYGHHEQYRGHEEGRGHYEDRGHPEYRNYPDPSIDVRIHG